MRITVPNGTKMSERDSVLEKLQTSGRTGKMFVSSSYSSKCQELNAKYSWAVFKMPSRLAVRKEERVQGLLCRELTQTSKLI